MADDRKHTERVVTHLTEREYIDLSREAERQDRKTGDLVRHVIRMFMYGTVACAPDELEGTGSANGCRE